jgi:hypothetical protein
MSKIYYVAIAQDNIRVNIYRFNNEARAQAFLNFFTYYSNERIDWDITHQWERFFCNGRGMLQLDSKTSVFNQLKNILMNQFSDSSIEDQEEIWEEILGYTEFPPRDIGIQANWYGLNDEKGKPTPFIAKVSLSLVQSLVQAVA